MQAQTPQGQSIEKVIDSFANGDANKKNVGNISEENVEFPHNGSLVEHLLPNRDTPVVPHISDTEHDNMSANFNGGTQALGCGKLKFSGCGPSPLCPDHSQREEHAEFSVDGTESREMLSDMAVQNVGDLSNDFANTFMLDEEIELEQKTIKNNDLSSARRYYMHLFLLNQIQLQVTTCICICFVIFILHLILYNDLFSTLEASVESLCSTFSVKMFSSGGLGLYFISMNYIHLTESMQGHVAY